MRNYFALKNDDALINDESLAHKIKEELFAALQLDLKNWRRFILTAIEEGNTEEALKLARGEY